MVTAPPSRIPWPPLLLVSGIAAGFLVRELTSVGVDAVGIGTALILLAIGIDLWAFVVFKRHRTAIRPDRAASALVTTGPFRWSRNPIYLANVLILIGFALRSGSYGFLLSAAAFVPLVTLLAIRPEERHLAATFGRAWSDYARGVRRWI